MRAGLWICAVACVGVAGCRRAPTSLVVVAPPSLEQNIREAAKTLGPAAAGTTLELRIARLDERSLEGADVVVAQSAAGLASVAPELAPGRVSFGCADEVVLIGPDGTPAASVKEALAHAETVVLADPRGPGEAAESALSRAGARLDVAGKLRYLPSPKAVIEAARAPGAVGLVLRSDLSTANSSGVNVLAVGFDGARQCPTAAALARSKKPALASALLAQLARAPVPQPALRKD